MFAKRIQESLDKIVIGNDMENEMYQSVLFYGQEKGFSIPAIQCVWKHYEGEYEDRYGHYQFNDVFEGKNASLLAAHLIEKAAYCAVNTENYLRNSNRGMKLWK